MTDIVDDLRAKFPPKMSRRDMELAVNETSVPLALLAHAADEIERLRAQVTDLTRLAGCAAIGKEFREIKKEAATIESIPKANFTHYWAGLCDENGNYKDQKHD